MGEIVPTNLADKYYYYNLFDIRFFATPRPRRGPDPHAGPNRAKHSSRHGQRTVRHLPSGAGHDTIMIASLTEMGMLCVRCGIGGIRHHPSESLAMADADLAGRVLADFRSDYSGESSHA